MESPDSVPRDDCFIPEAYTFNKASRLFSIVPQYSSKLKFTTVDYKTLVHLLRGTSIEIQQSNDVSHQAALFEQVFRFPADTVDGGKMKVYLNTVKIDDVAIDFTCMRSTTNAEKKLADLELEDFSRDEIENGYHLWAVDLGVTQPFVAVDGHENGPHQVRQMSAKEYRHLAGYDLSNARLAAWKNANNIPSIEGEIPTAKTSNKSTYLQHARYLLASLDTLLEFYGKQVAELRFLNYSGRQRADNEVEQVFVTGGQKYADPKSKRRQKKHHHKKKKKHKHIWKRPSSSNKKTADDALQVQRER